MTKCQVDQKDKNPFKNELNGIGILQNMIEIMSVINLIEKKNIISLDKN